MLQYEDRDTCNYSTSGFDADEARLCGSWDMDLGKSIGIPCNSQDFWHHFFCYHSDGNHCVANLDDVLLAVCEYKMVTFK